MALLSPEMKPRRLLAPGFQREGLPLWGLLTALFLLYQFVLAGRRLTLFLPHEVVWAWQEVEFPALGFWLAAGFYAYASAMCLFPRATARLSSLAFGAYYLYGAANSAPADLLLGFGEPLVVFLSPLLPAGAKDSLSWLWRSVHFPGLDVYAFHYYLTFYIFFTAILTFVYSPAREGSPRRRPSAVDILLFLLTLLFTVEYIVNFGARGERAGVILWNDVLMGTLAILVSVEMCRRLFGWILPILGILFFLYSMYGNYIPGRLTHSGFPFNEVVAFNYGNNGIFGVIAGVYASYVFLFILFGVFLEKTKVGDVFVKLAFAVVGHLRGGPAKAAVVSSGLVGMILGSGVPNIVITGTFTIPMMKRVGFAPHFAAAVEAVASTGGILMPPVMGAVAFLMAAFTETDYAYIALISFVPAVMYYYQCYMSVHHRSGVQGLHGMPRAELPRLWPILKKEGYLLLPVFLLVFRLIIGRSPFDAALWAIVLAVALGFFREDTRIVSLPPALARALGVPSWGTDADRAKMQAEKGKVPSLHEGGAAHGTGAGGGGGPVEPVGASGRALLRENWMLGAGGALFLLLLAAGAGFWGSLFWAVAATLLLSSPRTMEVLEKSALDSLSIGVTAGIMGVVLAGVSLPGLGLKFPSIIVGYSRVLVDLFGWSGTELPMTILLCGLAAYVMGMGMTISAAYILLSILAVPALVELGVPLLNAHLLTLWFTVTAPLTPPFALSAYVAAGIARCDPMKTGFTAVRLGWALYIVPFLIAYTPILMPKDATWPAILLTWVTGFMGFYCSAAGLEGFLKTGLKLPERALFLLASFLLFSNPLWAKAAGTALMGLGIGIQHLRAAGEELAPRPEPVAAAGKGSNPFPPGPGRPDH